MEALSELIQANPGDEAADKGALALSLDDDDDKDEMIQTNDRISNVECRMSNVSVIVVDRIRSSSTIIVACWCIIV